MYLKFFYPHVHKYSSIKLTLHLVHYNMYYIICILGYHQLIRGIDNKLNEILVESKFCIIKVNNVENNKFTCYSNNYLHILSKPFFCKYRCNKYEEAVFGTVEMWNYGYKEIRDVGGKAIKLVRYCGRGI